jgi:hypothetical protein
MKRLAIAAVGLALVAVLVLLAPHGSWAQRQPVASIALPDPGSTVDLYPGCNNVSLTFTGGTSSETVVQAVTPAEAVESMWRYSAAERKWYGYSPAFPEMGSLLTVDFLDTVWLCVAGPAPAPTAPTAAPTPGVPADAGTSAELIQPTDLEYLGAFRLPEGGERPRTFAYGGNAMTLNPNGDPSGPNDSFPGSLFITGHDRMPYGELPDGGQVAEVSIPEPVSSRSLADLNRAEFLQDFHDVAAGHFTQMEEIPRIGLLYLDNPATGPKIHIAYGQHFEPEPTAPTHAWFSPDLSTPDFQGEWFIGDRSFYSVNDYLLEIPAAWADAHAQGRYVGTGRFRSGGWSGMGPALFAYRPWADESGAPAPSGSHLEETTLLLYENSMNTESIERSLSGYQHPDDWAGGAWVTSASGKSALLFAGTKSNGTKYWYGWINPAGPEQPCIETELIGQFPLCRLADGSPCPPEDLSGCAGHNDYRGWWSTHFDAEFIFYDPADLARVAAGETASWEPQPYAVLDIDEHLFLNPSGVEQEMIGTGDQRRYRIGDVAYDRQNGLLYVLELFADEASPVVHVWRIGQ